MIEFFSSLSVFLGWVIQGAAQLFIVVLAMFGLVYLIDKKTLPSACNGNCNQGRNCNCKVK